MQLELGIIPVMFVIKQKRLNFLHYILTESTESLVKQVYLELKADNRKGDLVSLLNSDKEDLEINLSDDWIQDLPKSTWKKYLKEKIKHVTHKYQLKKNFIKKKN